MRKIGIPVTIRVNETTLAIARKIALSEKKPLRSFIREVVEQSIDNPKRGVK